MCAFGLAAASSTSSSPESLSDATPACAACLAASTKPSGAVCTASKCSVEPAWFVASGAASSAATRNVWRPDLLCLPSLQIEAQTADSACTVSEWETLPPAARHAILACSTSSQQQFRAACMFTRRQATVSKVREYGSIVGHGHTAL